MVHTCFWDKMCGIVGFNWDDKILVRKMAKTLEHRGPDQEGYYNDKHVSLGHRRLSIIDLSEKGRQPMHNENRDIWITYNGEVYNFMDIREELEKRGHKFYSNTDTEAIVHAYEEYGEACIEKLNGMFAFAIWDSKKNKLFCARDRLGIKPLYYFYKDNKFIFGSELKSILKYNWFKREINHKSLSYFFTYGYIPGNQTIFKDIYKIPPGHQLTYENNTARLRRYWEIKFDPKKNTRKYFTKNILSLLQESVRKRLIADVPVGAFLSGGIDSSAVVAEIKKYKDDLKTFSVYFDYESYDESKYIKLISDKFATQHYSLGFKGDDVLKTIPSLVDYFDEPFTDPSVIPTFLVSKLARKQVTVALTGEGGDELFGGYDRYNAYNILRWQKIIPSTVNKLLLPFRNLSPKLNVFLQYNGLDDYEIYSKMWSKVNNLGVNFLNLDPINAYSIHKKHFKYKSWLNNALNCDIHSYLAEGILKKADTCSMAHALEARVPFLDHAFVEFSAEIPPSLKIRRREKKYIFKESMKGILPKEIIYRKKKGFDTPLDNYFRKELRSYVYDILTSSEFKKISYLNHEAVMKMFEMHLRKENNFRDPIFAIIMFYEWYNKWFIEKTF